MGWWLELALVVLVLFRVADGRHGTKYGECHYDDDEDNDGARRTEPGPVVAR